MQVAVKDVVTIKFSRSVNIKFCVDAEWTESLIVLDFSDDVTTYRELSSARRRAYSKKTSAAPKEATTLDVFENLFASKCASIWPTRTPNQELKISLSLSTPFFRRHGLS